MSNTREFGPLVNCTFTGDYRDSHRPGSSGPFFCMACGATNHEAVTFDLNGVAAKPATAPHNPLIETVRADIKQVTEQAAELVEATYKAHGRCTLACDCGGLEVAIDADAVGAYASTSEVRNLLEHARRDHASPRNIVATSIITIRQAGA
jgi:hypothetical protein